jgi:aminoglycoside phosphotransferase
LTGFIDVSDCGIGDIWFDIAVTAKSIKRNYDENAVQLFYKEIQNKIGKIKHDIIDYYITLVEL